MATMDHQIKRIGAAAGRTAGVGLVLGIATGLAEAWLGQGWGAGVYLCLAVWFAFYLLGVHVFARDEGRFRPLTVWLAGLFAFAATFFATAGLFTFIAPPAFAFLTTQILNGLAYGFDPAARWSDQLQDVLASSAAQHSPSAVRAQVNELLQKRLHGLRWRYEEHLSEAEHLPTTDLSGRQFAKLIQAFTEVDSLPDEMRPLLGRAYLGLARNQAARDDKQLADTLKRARACPLPPGGTDFIAQQYATRQIQTADAIEAYLDYLRARRGLPQDPQDPVYRAAQAVCAVSQSATPARLIEVELHARAFLDADDRLGWAAFRLGQTLLWRGQPQPALASLQRAAALMPGRSEPLVFTGRAHLALGMIDPALQTFRDALAADPGDREAMYYLGHTLVAEGRAEQLEPSERRGVVAEARRYLEAVVAAQPERAEAHYALGLAYLAVNEHAEARRCLERALALNSTSADWHFHHARTLAALDETDGAIAAARRAIDSDGQHRPALHLLGSQLIRARRWSEAESPYRALLTLDGTDAEALIGLGRALFELGQWAEAVERLQASPAPHRDRLYYLGRALAKAGDFQAGLGAYQNALAKFGPDADLCYALGCAQAHLGKLDAALAAFDQSLSLADSGKAHLQRGHVLLARDEGPAALAEYESAVQLSSDLPDAHHALGVYYYRNGDADQAQRAFDKALKLDSDYAPAHLGLGVLLEAVGDFAGAEKRYRQALAADGPRAELTVRLGVVTCKQEQFKEAIDPLTEARQGGLRSDELLYHLGLAHARLNNWTEAIAAWTPLAERYPDDESLRHNLARCQYGLGHERFNAGDFVGAVEAWEVCAGMYADDETLQEARAEAHFRQAIALLRFAARGEPVPPAARAGLQRAAEAGGGDDPRIRLFTALADLAGGDAQAAVRGLCSLNDSPGDTQAAYHLGFALRQAGQPDQAVPYLEQSLRAGLLPHLHQGACLMLADIHSAASRWPEAARMYREALEA